MIWTVTKTPCFPNSFKVHPKGFIGSNAPCYFFVSEREAWTIADQWSMSEIYCNHYNGHTLCESSGEAVKPNDLVHGFTAGGSNYAGAICPLCGESVDITSPIGG